MITRSPKIVVNENGPANCFPDDAPTEYTAVSFDGVNYIFYEEFDVVPPVNSNEPI